MPPRDATATGHRIVALALPEDASLEVAVATCQRVLGGLREGLGRWIGADAFDALLERALLDARSEHAVLAEARWCPSDERPLVGLPGPDRGATATDVRVALAALIDGITAHLGRFIGEDLATRIVLDCHRPPRTPDRREEP
ncbi:MAG: hypothetical protein ACOZNI_05670 [Myxococcota bacterium]